MGAQVKQPPDERVLRGIKQKMNTDLRLYISRRLPEINKAKRHIDAEKKAAAAHFKARESQLDTESVSLESVSSALDGKEVEVVSQCLGRVNLSTGQYDIYVLERDDEGREFSRFSHSEPLPDQHIHLLQEDFLRGEEGDKKPPPPPDDKKAAPKGGKKNGKPPPEFPGEDGKKR